MQVTHEIEQKTGTPNPVYDILSVMYHALQGAETYDRYIADAEERGDDDLADFFREVQERNREVAHRAKKLLRERLDM
jgi:rubrerythrin